MLKYVLYFDVRIIYKIDNILSETQLSYPFENPKYVKNTQTVVQNLDQIIFNRITCL